MPAGPQNSAPDLTPEAVLARATAARGDIFPEWRILAHASPATYDLVTHTGGYFHQYHGESSGEQHIDCRPALPEHHEADH